MMYFIQVHTAILSIGYQVLLTLPSPQSLVQVGVCNHSKA